jgi:hypothetical protein
MSNELETAPCPFTGHDEQLINVKFFRGKRDDVITAQEIKEEARRVAMQHRMKTADVSQKAPKSAHQPINVAELVATL